MSLTGSCHCGNITFTLDWTPPPLEITARACDCSFCVKHGGLWTSNPQGALQVLIRDPALHSHYHFGTHTARFHVCRQCGVVPLVTSEIDGQAYAVVSVNALDHIDRSRLRTAPMSFGDEDTTARLARRVRGWIPRVSFTVGPA